MPPTEQTGGFRLGKLPPSALLRSVLPYLGKRNRNVLVKPGIGRDAAIIKYGGRVLVFSTDPITGTANNIGARSVTINANDIATTGAKPIWYLCTILLPTGTPERSLKQIMIEIDHVARDLGIAVVGGHTEVTSHLERPIIAGFMVGEISGGRVLSAGAGQVGDSVLFTKTAGLEGASILASDYSHRLRSVPSQMVRRAKRFSQQIGVVSEALALARIPGVHAIHDPTEGGALNGLWELAEASELGMTVWADRIPVAYETEEICSVLRLDPLKLMSSGSLVVAVQPSGVGTVVRKLRKMGLRVSEIGKLTHRRTGRYLFRGGKSMKLEAVPRDELYRLA